MARFVAEVAGLNLSIEVSCSRGRKGISFYEFKQKSSKTPTLAKVINIIEMIWGENIKNLSDLEHIVTISRLMELKNIGRESIKRFQEELEKYNIQLRY